MKQSINETRGRLILQLFQMEFIRFLDMGAGVLGQTNMEAHHHLQGQVTFEGQYQKK